MADYRASIVETSTISGQQVFNYSVYDVPWETTIVEDACHTFNEAKICVLEAILDDAMIEVAISTGEVKNCFDGINSQADQAQTEETS